MQKVGDVCENCQSRWEDRGKEPKVLQASSGKATKTLQPIPLCPYCDGGTLEISALDLHEPLQEG